MDPRARERAECRRPIEDGEIPVLEALGARLLELRRAAGLTRWKLSQGAKLSENTIARIELGTRRTRGTTLERIAEALGKPDVVDELIELAGPALAPESQFAERIARRRERRWRRARRWSEPPQQQQQGPPAARREVELLVSARRALERAQTLQEISAARQLILRAIEDKRPGRPRASPQQPRRGNLDTGCRNKRSSLTGF